MCNEGARLYNAWAALVPQVKQGDKDIRDKIAQKSAAAESARQAYEAHCRTCRICHVDTVTAAQIAQQNNFQLPYDGAPAPEWR